MLSSSVCYAATFSAGEGNGAFAHLGGVSVGVLKALFSSFGVLVYVVPYGVDFVFSAYLWEGA